ncbi:hypothetical protein DCC85_17620 [Paenibacillus sp. CAA11]|uniref:hypothetical protein n=1 Tax=Paenibacillus sp. CAA11 TaxID=1532905 RepID=UPI000D36CC38|nr:hypothetical protein [Paenibacillus sp. CAA11]AWB45823.1 hypothetical protein DCC85_17620 [Paenibacillus sp. CAA11]
MRIANGLQSEEDVAVWQALSSLLPDTLQFPDPSFIQTLDLTGEAEQHLMELRAMTPSAWSAEDPLWAQIASRLPSTYTIPDLALLKRQLET